jgi:hypothetical protein
VAAAGGTPPVPRSLAEPAAGPASPPAEARPRAEPVASTQAMPAAAAAAPSPRIVIHYRAGSATAQEAAAMLRDALRDAAAGVQPELRTAPGMPTQRVVRYFHAQDAAAAARLAGRLGRGWVVQDFRGYEPHPAPGLLEIWLPER